MINVTVVRATHIQLLKGRAIAQQVKCWPADLAVLGSSPICFKKDVFVGLLLFFHFIKYLHN